MLAALTKTGDPQTPPFSPLRVHFIDSDNPVAILRAGHRPDEAVFSCPTLSHDRLPLSRRRIFDLMSARLRIDSKIEVFTPFPFFLADNEEVSSVSWFSQVFHSLFIGGHKVQFLRLATTVFLPPVFRVLTEAFPLDSWRP